MSHETQRSDPFSSLKSPIIITKSLKFILLPSGQDVLSSPQQTRCSPSLVNEVFHGVCQTSWQHLPCQSAPGSYPQPDQWQPSPFPALVCPLLLCIKAEVQLVTSHFDVCQGYFSIHDDV